MVHTYHTMYEDYVHYIGGGHVVSENIPIFMMYLLFFVQMLFGHVVSSLYTLLHFNTLRFFLQQRNC